MSWGILLVATCLGIIALTLLAATLSIAPWVPTRRRDLKRIFELADLKEGESFYDFGSGTGTLIFSAAKMTKGNPVGVEMSMPLYIFSQIKKYLTRNKKVNFILKNAHAVDLSKIDVLYIFGMPGRFEKLKAKLKKEAPAGMRLISYAFALEGLEPERVDKPSDKDLPIYLYRF